MLRRRNDSRYEVPPSVIIEATKRSRWEDGFLDGKNGRESASDDASYMNGFWAGKLKRAIESPMVVHM